MKNLIKEKNLRLLRDALRQERMATKSRLAELTGISVVTVQSLLESLLETGEVSADQVIKPQLGRPAVSYRFEERARLVLALCMAQKNGRATAAVSVVDLYGRCIDFVEVSYDEVEADSWNEVIDRKLHQYPNIEQIALGLPGSEAEGKLVVCDYPSLRGLNLASYLHDRFGVPVMIENDINAATYGFCVREGLLAQSVAGIILLEQYPPGAAICEQGRLLKGRSGLAGEIKYLPLDIDWSGFSYESEAVKDFLLKAVKIFQCMYNPHVIVIYSREEPGALALEYQEQQRSLQESDTEDVGRLLAPELCFRKGEDLYRDFAAGLAALALTPIL